MEELEYEGVKISDDVYAEILKNTDKISSYAKDSRIAIKAMVQLVKSDHATFLFLRDDESREWWSKLVTNATETVATRKKNLEIYEAKMSVWNRLTQAERTALGIRKPAKPR